MTDTRTTTPSQIAAGALTHHPAPKPRTVTTTQTTGELSLRYIPRPTPSPDVPETKCGNTSKPATKWQVRDRVRIRSEYQHAGECGTVIFGRNNQGVRVRLDHGPIDYWPPEALEPAIDSSTIIEHLSEVCVGIGPKKAGKLYDAFGEETLLVICADPDRAAMAIGGTAKSRATMNRAAKYIEARAKWLPHKSLLPCPGPVPVVPRPGSDTLIPLADAHQQAVAIARRAAAREENDRDERLLDLSHTYRRELLCFPA